MRAAPETAASGPVGVDEDEVRTLLTRYAELYGNEDAAALGRLFADDIVRLRSGDAAQDGEGALAEYEAQFAALADPLYQLTDISVDAAGAHRATLHWTGEGWEQ